MHTALVTTTVNIPHVLSVYRAHAPDMPFIVVGDLKEPPGIVEFCDSLGATFLSAPIQTNLGYKCSDLIGQNCIQRRNIGFLEALRTGADVIVSIDDDNIPTDPAYFDHVEYAFSGPHSGIETFSHEHWFDPGQLLVPPAKHRGFPVGVLNRWGARGIAHARVGVVAGLCLGDPDVDAVTRIATAPEVHGTHALAQHGVVTNPAHTWTVFNSQNTAFIRELAPAMFMLPGVGRFDDIYASLICQRVMRERGLHVRFGQPFVFQQRNPHNLMADLRAEIFGMDTVLRMANTLDILQLPRATMTEQLVDIYGALRPFLPEASVAAALAWLDDIEQVL